MIHLSDQEEKPHELFIKEKAEEAARIPTSVGTRILSEEQQMFGVDPAIANEVDFSFLKGTRHPIHDRCR